MSDFKADRHQRDKSSGRFTTMGHAPGKPLAFISELARRDRNYAANQAEAILRHAAAFPTSVQTVIPANSAASLKALRNPRGLQHGFIRQVALHSANTPDTSTVSAPKDGRPLGISIASNAPRTTMDVVSGKAVIAADSFNGTTIRVAPGAEAVIISGSGRPVAVEVPAGAKAKLMSDGADHGFTVTGDGDIITDYPKPLPVTAPSPESAEDDTAADWDEDDDSCTSCGEPTDDGEGWDGMCGNCADRAETGQVFDMELTAEDGEPATYSVNRLDEDHYEVEDADGTAVLEFHTNCDPEDHTEIQSAAVNALRGQGVYVYEHGEEPGKLGSHAVAHKSLAGARELAAELSGAEYHEYSPRAHDWAAAKGYEAETVYNPDRFAELHQPGAIVVDPNGPGIALPADIDDGYQTVKLDGRIGLLQSQEDNDLTGEVPVTFIYPEPGTLGGHEVPQKSLQRARTLEDVLSSVPDWKRTETAERWAESRGYEFTSVDDWSSADNAHGRGAVIVDPEDVGVATEYLFGRNSWITLEGDGTTFPDDEDWEEGDPGTITVIYMDGDGNR